MSWPSIFLWLIIAFLFGWYFALHPLNLLADINLLYNFTLLKIHGTPTCPQHFNCTAQ